ncbi:MAG: tRNA lysidine(34) synthetase TilS [Sphingorhabdus sp.]
MMIDPVDRLSTALQRLTSTDPKQLDVPGIGLAVSGGPDSLALMLLANEAFPKAIRIATIDHGLRPEAAEEAAYVAHLCAERGLPHDRLKPDQPITGNIQSAARMARYALLNEWADRHGLRWIATAHHADDQFETLLMRMARGSGLAGLASIRETNGRIIRPLLGFTKTELVAICERYGVAPCNDPSNANADFDRVQIRNWLQSAPELLDSRRAARTTAALREAHDALEWITQRLVPERIDGLPGGAVTLDPQGLPAEIVRRLLIHALRQIDATLAPRGETADRTLEALHRGGRLTVGEILCTGGLLWTFEPAPKRRPID